MKVNGKDIQMKIDYYADALEKDRARVGNGELAFLIVQQIGKDLRTAQIQCSSGNSDNGNCDVLGTPKANGVFEKTCSSFRGRDQ